MPRSQNKPRRTKTQMQLKPEPTSIGSFPKNTYMTSKGMKRYSVPVIFRKMQTQTTASCHLTTTTVKQLP